MHEIAGQCARTFPEHLGRIMSMAVSEHRVYTPVVCMCHTTDNDPDSNHLI